MRSMTEYKTAFRMAYEFMERYLNLVTDEDWRAAVKDLETMDNFTSALVCVVLLEIERVNGGTT